ncbi:MAG: hypothetical protein ACXVII_42160, partial [Solirubrobacteraceae bacterium]
AAAGVALAAAGIDSVPVAGSAIAERRRPARFCLVERVVGGAQRAPMSCWSGVAIASVRRLLLAERHTMNDFARKVIDSAAKSLSSHDGAKPHAV